MTTRRSIKLTLISLVGVIVACLVVLITLLSNNAMAMPSMFSSAYNSSGVTGVASASYQIGTMNKVDMKSSSGETLLSFNENDNSDTQILAPEGKIVLTEENYYVVFTYKFINSGKTDYVASVVYNDVDNDDKNIDVSYLSNGVVTDNEVYANWNNDSAIKSVVVKSGREVECSIKIKVDNFAFDATFSGNFDWTLSI